MADNKRPGVTRLDREGAETLGLADSYARALERLARRMQIVATAVPFESATVLRSAALRLSHAANEAMGALLAVIVQSARLDALATIRATQEAKESPQCDNTGVTNHSELGVSPWPRRR
jgi:hypothetical protein